VVTLAINKALLPKQPYDPDTDLVLVGQFLSTYNMLAVTNSLPVKSVKELGRLREEKPGQAAERVRRQRHHRASRRESCSRS
jgi:tripartite-type tricarboxylate transporter receptor subunit TctC